MAIAAASAVSFSWRCLSSGGSNNNRVLGPPSSNETTRWDRYGFAGPVVVPAGARGEAWRMYYYGRESEMWNLGVPAMSPWLPTGRIGMAISSDGGKSFQRFAGPETGGAILCPSDDPTAFDCLHIAVGDVVYDHGRDLWLLYYFGGGMEETQLPGLPAAAKGALFLPGLAVSEDGVHFRRRNPDPILAAGDPGEWDELGISWPRVLPPPPPTSGGHRHQQYWTMSYHSHEEKGKCTSAGIAVSTDGVLWEKKGKVLTKGEPGSWDESGVGVRHIIRFNGQYLMFYEGRNEAFEYCIGLAVSEDGVEWRKDGECGDEPGGPLLRARRGETEAWDNWVVGTPYVVEMGDGSLRMYYMGLGLDATLRPPGQRGIGVAASNGADFRSWSRLL